MSHLQYFAYPGFGDRVKADTHYSQSVRLPSPTVDIIKISGQGGWDRTTEVINPDWAAQMDQALENVDVTLKVAGGKGWEQVYQLRAYFAPLDMEAAGAGFVRNLKKWCPNHQPLVTAVGVEKFAFENMKIEIEVEAHLGNENERGSESKAEAVMMRCQRRPISYDCTVVLLAEVYF